MLRWSFDRAGFRLNPSDLLGAVVVVPTPVLELMSRSSLSTIPSYIRNDYVMNSCSNQSASDDSGLQGRRSL
jgi:hypothetical protein